MTLLDLNSDLGESFGVYTLGNDAAMLEIVTSANIACGFHAGDPLVMAQTVERAGRRGVGIGAHPSFLDLWGFGRRPILGERPADVEKHIIYQIGALRAIAEAAGYTVQHVKTHGSLGNMAGEDPDLAQAVARAIRAVDRDLIFLVMPGLETERAGEAMGLRLAREIYADRAYAENGNLVSRKEPGAVIHDTGFAVERLLRMIETGAIETTGGARIPARIDSVCIHGDTPGAVEMARSIRDRLIADGVALVPLSEVVEAG